MTKVCLIGLGEVGRTLAEDLIRNGFTDLAAWDLKFDDPESMPSRNRDLLDLPVRSDARHAASGVDLIVSAVTAAQTLAAARDLAAGSLMGTFFLDLNSASPQSKQEAARIVGKAGGRYVEASVMSPIAPKRIETSILLGGPHAAEFLRLGHRLGFSGASVFSDEYGLASAAKMCRSVMIKGIEALLTESLLSARHFGVEDTVLKSLDDLFPIGDWRVMARYMISRSVEHGTRRAEEMREAAKTVAEAGLSPWMSSAIAERQDWTAGRGELPVPELLSPMLDALLASLDSRKDAAE